MTHYLVRLECGSIQSYIFASNRLREAIGASHLVKQATEGFLENSLSRVTASNAITDWQKQQTLSILNKNEVEAEILYSGGGNAVVVFRQETLAKTFISDLSSQLLSLAPDLNLLVGIASFEDGTLGEALLKAQDALENLKEAGVVGLRLQGIGITRSCASTGLAAAIGYEEKRSKGAEWISPAAAARRRAASEAANSSLLRSVFKKVLPNFEIPFDLDNLGGAEGERHMAVVHADGNGIGKRLLALVTNPDPDNQVLAAQVRAFSKSVQQAAEDSFRELVEELLGKLEALEDKGLQRVGKYFPLRPIVYGGDDLTFVCEGQLGLSLAARYLELFNQKHLSDENGLEVSQPLSACAGVAIARNHFPLSRAYRLAEELCGEAKKKTRTRGEEGSSWLDFHLIYGGHAGKMESIRPPHDDERNLEYSERLFWRPWRVQGAKQDESNWDNFKKILERFRQWPRSQVKGFRDALVSGENATKDFLGQASLRGNLLYEIPNFSTSEGWAGLKTPYFDPIDALDFYLD